MLCNVIGLTHTKRKQRQIWAEALASGRVAFPPWYTESSRIRDCGRWEALNIKRLVYISGMLWQQLYIEA